MFTISKLFKQSFNAALLVFVLTLAFSKFTNAQRKYKPLKGVTSAGTVVKISSLPQISNFSMPKKVIPYLAGPQYSKSVKQYQQQQANSSTLKVSKEQDKSVSQLFLPKSKTPLRNFVKQSPQSATLSENFQGINSTGSEPPDPIIAAGNSYIVEAVNSEIAIFNKSGTRQKTVQLTTLFNISTVPFDPRVIYDQYAQRWVVTALEKSSDFTTSNYEIAVSQTSDPTGSWYAFTSDASLDGSQQTGYWADYDNLGYDNSAIYITSNQFYHVNSTTDDFEYAKIRIFNKSQLYNNQTLTYTDFVDMSDNYGLVFAIIPAQNFGSTSSEYLLNTEEWGASSITIWRIDNPLNSPSLTQQAIVNVASYSSDYSNLANLVKQKGTSLNINGGDSRAQQVIFNNGFLYTSFNTLYNWGSGTVEACRYEKVDINSNSMVIDVVYGADGYYYFYPQIGIDNYGDIGLVFDRSSSNEYPGVYMAYRTAIDASASSSEALQAGAGPFTNSNALQNGNLRWGDYSGMCLDPSSNNQLWFCGEWATNSNDWSTQIGSFQFVPVAFVNSVGGSSGGGTLQINSSTTINSGSSLRLGLSTGNTELTLAQGGGNQDRFVNTNNVALAKHNNWDNVSSSYLLNNNFPVNGTPGETETAYFISLNSATINAVSDAGNVQLQLNDPWYMNSNGSQGNNFAQAASPITQTSAPMTGAYNQTSGGVFLFQNPSFSLQLPNYSVGFPAQSVSAGGTSHPLYLSNWTASGANIQNSTAAQTGIEFTSSSATVTANVKGVHLSNDASAFSNNSQRKLVRTSNGWLSQVYTSLGHAWIEHSSDNGNSWILGNDGHPLDYWYDGSPGSKCPSIDYISNYNIVVASYQREETGNHYSIQLGIFVYTNGQWTHLDPQTIYYDNTQLYSSTDANPNISFSGSNDFLVTFEHSSASGQLGVDCMAAMLNLNTGAVTGQSGFIHIPGTDGNSTNSAVACYRSIYPYIYDIAWQQNSGTQKQIEVSWVGFAGNGGNMYSTGQGSLGVISNNSSPVNESPSIIEMPDGNVQLCWITDLSGGNHDPGSTYVIYWDSRYTSYYNEFGYNPYSVSINQSNDTYDPVRFVWAEYDGSAAGWWGYISDGQSTIEQSSNGGFGQNVQLSNGQTSGDLLTSTFYPFSAPYYFSTFVNALGKVNPAAAVTRRGVALHKGSLNYYYTFGNLNVDGKNVDFVPAPDSLNYRSVDTVNMVLETKPFQVTNNSKIIFNECSRFVDSTVVAKVLGRQGFVDCKIDLIDPSTNSVIGTIKDLKQNSSNYRGYNYAAYQLNPNGIGTKTAAVRITITSNIDSIKSALITGFAYNTAGGNGVESVALNQLTLHTIKTYSLEQNYPNPFNPTTTIEYTLPIESKVKLEIFDILGRKILLLVNKDQGAGTHSAIFDGGDLASGVYFYRLSAGNFTETKKLMLIK